MEGQMALKRAIVTGDTGFLGSHLTARLERDGTEIVGFSLSRGQDILTGGLPLSGVERVFHLAGRTFVPDAWADPEAFYRANAVGTMRVLEQCRQAGIPVTFISTYVYGRPDRLPVSEDAPPRPNNPYTFSKLAAEEACRFYAAHLSTSVAVLRVFNVYGPGQRPDFIIPKIARQVMDPAVPVIEVADLSPRRDYVHVDDVIEALLASGSLPSGQPFNVGSGMSHSVEDVIKACLNASGIDKPYQSRNEFRPGEIADVIADVSALKQQSGWRPRISLADGIASVVASINPATA